MFVRLDISQETADRKAWEDLLAASGLRPDPPYSAVYGIYEEGRLAATGARDRSRLKCVAVDPAYRGSSLFSRLLTGIIAEAFDADINKLFLYTRPEAAASFSRVGFRTLAVTPQGITFMERGRPSLSEYLDRLAREQPAQDPFEAVLADTGTRNFGLCPGRPGLMSLQGCPYGREPAIPKSCAMTARAI